MRMQEVIRKLFTLALWVKLADGTLEFIVGVLLAFGQKQAVWLANDIAHLPPWLQQFLVLYLISHGVVKLFLVGSLFRKKMWAYPAFVAFFSVFICYEWYRYVFDPSLLLLGLILFDLAVTILVFLEYRRVLKYNERVLRNL